ncbi:hypothetical protein Tco_0313351, partial [Tanacetum coccineum]
LSSGYIADSDPEEDEEDPEEDHADHPADGGDNDDNESSGDDDDDDDVENEEEEEHQLRRPFSCTYIDLTLKLRYRGIFETSDSCFYTTQPLHTIINLFSEDQNPGTEMMTTINQGMSVEEIEQVVAQRVANAIEAIAIYETKTNMARKSISQTKREEDKVAENASNKRKWEGNHNGSSSQQNKGHKVPRAHTTRPINNKAYVDLYLCATSANFTIMDCAL